MAVEIEQVESIEPGFRGEALAAAAAERLLQRPEIRCATLIKHHRLSVEDRAVDTKLSRVMRDRRKARRPVKAPTGDDPDALANDVYGKPIAVPFHLESPVLADRRLALEQR